MRRGRGEGEGGKGGTTIKGGKREGEREVGETACSCIPIGVFSLLPHNGVFFPVLLSNRELE